MEDTKPWWASKAIWTGVVGAGFGLAATFKLLPEGLTQEELLGGIMAIVSLLGVIFRGTATHKIG